MKTLLRPVPAGRSLTFDENGNAIVTVGGDEDCANIYFTVGNGSAPSDPTDSAYDGMISGRNGTASSGVKISTGSVAYVKARGYDSGGNPGPVFSAQQARRLGPFHKDTTTRDIDGSEMVGFEDTIATITIPAGVLGTDGGVDIDIYAGTTDVAGNGATLRVRLGSDLLIAVPVPGGTTYKYHFDIQLFNDGADDAQDVRSVVVYDATGSNPLVRSARTTHSEDSTSDMDITVTIDWSGASSSYVASVYRTYGKLLGTD